VFVSFQRSASVRLLAVTPAGTCLSAAIRDASKGVFADAGRIQERPAKRKPLRRSAGQTTDHNKASGIFCSLASLMRRNHIVKIVEVMTMNSE
jgi:hypothetical protein